MSRENREDMREMGGASVCESGEDIVDVRFVVVVFVAFRIGSEDTSGENAEFVLECPFGGGEFVGKEGPAGAVSVGLCRLLGQTGSDVERVGRLQCVEKGRVFGDLSSQCSGDGWTHR